MELGYPPLRKARFRRVRHGLGGGTPKRPPCCSLNSSHVKKIPVRCQVIRAIQAISRLKQPNLIHISSRFIPTWICIIVVMELADGSCWSTCWPIGRRPTTFRPSWRCVYLAQAADALDFLKRSSARSSGPTHGLSTLRCQAEQPVAVRRRCQAFRILGYRRDGATDPPQGKDSRPMPPRKFFRAWASSDWTDQYSLAVTYCEVRGGPASVC